ncbi:hypothetical protein SAMN05428984_4106 [Sphingomonas sp. OK281]|nr:hypothetical protein SAMN05428984_4106 [Sphingomonas sp. OK281]
MLFSPFKPSRQLIGRRALPPNEMNEWAKLGSEEWRLNVCKWVTAGAQRIHELNTACARIVQSLMKRRQTGGTIDDTQNGLRRFSTGTA